MKAYGLPREKDIEGADKSDISYYGLSSKHKYRYRGKRKTRRIWKKRVRTRVRRFLIKLGEVYDTTALYS